MRELVQKRFDEINRFFTLLELADFNLEFNKTMLIGFFPFRDTDIEEEVREFEIYYHREFNSLNELIIFLHNRAGYDYTKFLEFTTLACVNYATLATDWRFGNNPYKLNLTIEQTKKEFLRLYEEPQSDYRKAIVGRMAEFLVNEELKNNSTKEVYWISELYGDGFGYDFITKEGNNCEFLEVKGTTKNRPEVELSDNEANTFREMEQRNNPIEKYHVIIVNFMYIKDDLINYDVIDVYYENNIITHKSVTNRFYYNVLPVNPEDKYKKIMLL